MKVCVGCPHWQIASASHECLKCDKCILQSDSCRIHKFFESRQNENKYIYQPSNRLRKVEGVFEADEGSSEPPGDLGHRGPVPVTEHGGEHRPLLDGHQLSGHLGVLRRIWARILMRIVSQSCDPSEVTQLTTTRLVEKNKQPRNKISKAFLLQMSKTYFCNLSRTIATNNLSASGCTLRMVSQLTFNWNFQCWWWCSCSLVFLYYCTGVISRKLSRHTGQS